MDRIHKTCLGFVCQNLGVVVFTTKVTLVEETSISQGLNPEFSKNKPNLNAY